MSKIALVTDSTAYLPPEFVEQYNIHVLPLNLHWGEETLQDGIDISADEFYKRLAQSPTLPTTSQVSVHQFSELFKQLSADHEGILCIVISSGISGTYDSAEGALQEFDTVPVKLIDTRTTACGQALAVMAAVRALEDGMGLEETGALVEGICQKMSTNFVVDTLEYLHKGGRIGGASRYLGTALNIKPILELNDEGKIEALERVRTKKKALERLISLAEEQVGDGSASVGVMHASSPQAAQEFLDQVQ
ncbi:MAG: DegV family protein, partial [Anaerolineales bacterium]|nr:DegV family protein [Anaerolineales bacterium]